MIVEISDEAPPAWRDLIEALALMSKGSVNEISPTHCEHDELWVMSDPSDFTTAEIDKLHALGFSPDDVSFRSFRFGSA